MVEDTVAPNTPVATLEEPSGRARDAPTLADLERREAQLRARLVQEEERLEKLWDAYAAQERELRAAKAQATELEAALKGKEGLLAAAEKAIHARDTDLAELTAQNATLTVRVKALEAQREELAALDTLKRRLAETEAGHAAERERLAKLFIVYEELAEDNQKLSLQLKERDLWIKENMALLDTLHARRADRPRTPEEGEQGTGPA